MSIEQLGFHGLRNLQPLTLHPGAGINLLSGANGSGKTSLLEGIHILGMGRSFRTRQLKNAIQHDAAELTLFGRLAGEHGASGTTLGVRRLRDERELELRLRGERQARLSELVEALPLQLINPDAFRLLEGSPAGRREFLDWGVFHVKHEFLTGWKRVRRALKHRNALLRRGRIDSRMDASQLDVWEYELATWGEQVDRLRRDWFSAFLPVFEQTLDALLPLEGLSLHYARGWDKKRSLGEVLSAARTTDEHMGFTQQGPQRADLRIRIHKKPAIEVLSRGQQKLVVSALKLAQGRLLESTSGLGSSGLGSSGLGSSGLSSSEISASEHSTSEHSISGLSTAGRHCVYLIDDLPAELDDYHQQRFCELLEAMQCQAFITSVEPNALHNRWLPATAVNMFHVKHDGPGTPGQPALSRLVQG